MNTLLRNVELIVYKSYADLKAEAARGYLGMLWWVIEPILFMSVFYVVFSSGLVGRKGGAVAFILVGLVPWKWFASTVANGAKSITNGVGLMHQVYLPKYVFPCVVMATNFVKFALVFVLMLVFLLLYGVPPALVWLAVPVIVFVQFMFVLAITGILAAITPFVPDIKQILDNVLMLMFFLSGVLFDVSAAPESVRHYLYLNPMLIIIENYRLVLVDGMPPSWGGLLVIAIISVVVLGVALSIMARFDRLYPKLVMR